MSVFIVDEMFEERAAETLHDGAHDLPVQGQRVDDAAGVFDRDIVEKFHVPGLGIDGDVGGVRAVAIGSLVAGIGGFRRSSGKGGKRKRLPVGTEHGPRVDLDVFFRAAPSLGRRRTDRIAQLCRRHDDGVAAHHHRARAVGAVAVDHVIGRAVEHVRDVGHRHIQSIRRDLGTDRFEALADG